MAASIQLAEQIERVQTTRYNHPDSEAAAVEGLRDQLRQDRRVINRSAEAAASYYSLLLDDQPKGRIVTNMRRKMQSAFGKVLNEGFNFSVLKDWLDRGELPGDRANDPGKATAPKAHDDRPPDAPGLRAG